MRGALRSLRSSIAVLLSLLFETSSALRLSTRASAPRMSALTTAQKLLVIGGNGYAGREICKNAVKAGYQVTSLSRRGQNPIPGDELLQQVQWTSGNALNQADVDAAVANKDAVVHCIGLLFDANSGLQQLNDIVSGSKAAVTEESTYDNITRQTCFNLLQAVKAKGCLLYTSPSPRDS